MKPPAPHTVLAVIASFFVGLALTSSGAVAPGTDVQTDLISNGSFEGTLADWSPYNSTLALATDGVIGADAVQVLANGRVQYGIESATPPVADTVASATYTTTVWARSDTPGRNLCLRLREWTTSGSLVNSATTCQASTAGWAQFPWLSYVARGSHDQIDVFLFQKKGSTANSFEADGFVLSGPPAQAPTAVAPANTSPPTVSGTAQAGQTLTVDPGAWSGTAPLSFAYQWRRCDGGGNTCADISGATGASYTLATADVGSTLRAVVTASNVAGSSAATSAATAVVAATPVPAPANTSLPTISGTPVQGQTLTASPGSWTNAGSYAYQWRRCDSTGASCADVSGATAQTYALVSADVGATLKVAVTAKNATGSTTATSASTAVITAQPTQVSTSCSKYASTSGSDSASGTATSPYRTAQTLVDSLSPGQTGCLKGGVYAENIGIRSGGQSGSPITLTSDPSSSRATILGTVEVTDSANYVTLSNLKIDGAPLFAQTVEIEGDFVTVRDSEITNEHLGGSCFSTGSHTWGYAYNVVIDHNRIHACGPIGSQYDHGIYAGVPRNGRITNNTMYDISGFGVHLYSDADGTVVQYNVIDSSGEAGVVFGGDEGYASDNNLVAYNIITYNSYYGISHYWGGPVGVGNVADHNCFWGNSPAPFDNTNGYTATNNIVANPLFVDRANGNYTLSAGSPCAAMGPRS